LSTSDSFLLPGCKEEGRIGRRRRRGREGGRGRERERERLKQSLDGTRVNQETSEERERWGGREGARERERGRERERERASTLTLYVTDIYLTAQSLDGTRVNQETSVAYF
jgi:hypothetical protein